MVSLSSTLASGLMACMNTLDQQVEELVGHLKENLKMDHEEADALVRQLRGLGVKTKQVCTANF